MGWWVADYLQANNGLIIVLSWTFWVFLSICLHELSHGWAAIWEGDDTPIVMGRMTWNPLVHMGGFSIIAFVLIGIAWGLMPVNPRRFRHGAKGDALVAAAGPAMNLVLALFTCTILVAILKFSDGNVQSDFRDKVILFFFYGARLNAVLLLLNLLPIPPLDGSKILGGLWRPAAQFYSHPEIGQYSIFALVAVFFFGGRFLFSWADAATNSYINLLLSIFG